ncbi:restriction endonuclease subunit S [Staphylococcus argenteus]|uniref:restriction endonuclease subunit S n=1 Tax=Staphylococcus argenteus TaxID=985002 RepID=UPI001EFE0646|nr:restriction endonuclease subunit S [Staphylococcus argenteus]MCG9802765.1 restriction endonuclease subunit S [Staphylococcus argenteus]MCG9810800.1 restriction endonuclease subunit S [Staphylococcus argenteus]MCG9822832.1 restriction endonuclease subunit S [Staphylococcus argenteus]
MSNTQKKNVPELRFPEFEGEWEEKKLGDITDRLIRKNKNLESKKPLTISGQLGLIDQTEYFSKSVSSKNLENYTLIKNGEFAYNKSYSNGYPLGAIKRLTRYDSGVLSSLYICFAIKSEISKDFIEAYFDSTHWYREVSGIAVEGARNHGLLNISVNDFFTILIKYPSLEEQRKIGGFFIKLNRQIELEEQKLELLQQQKKGYMQKIFSQELRFKDENGDDYPEWEEKKMGEITTMFSGGTPQSTNTRYYKGDIPFIRSGEISKTYTEVKINEEALNNSSAKLVEVGDLLYALYGATSGEVAISKINGAINQAVLCIRTNESIEFLLNYLFFSKNKILNTFIQGGQGNLSANIIKNLIIEIPTIIEQRKIGDFFCNIDNLIEIQERKLEFLKQRKQSLLQKMFV